MLILLNALRVKKDVKNKNAMNFSGIDRLKALHGGSSPTVSATLV